MTVKPYSIWWAFVPYADDPARVKKRPVLIIDPRKNIAVCLRMTSKPRKASSDYIIIHWAEAGLTKPTVINTAYQIILKHRDLETYIGQLHEQDELTLRFRYNVK
ncbi:MAG: type II toxin-antitoxin system PemK/MazF family toxin [Clostridiales Family XIII bacterium]|jgi:hypothetical protein|nr:type II toxin-antitoxin system PemK/MazF family toxin [Clostridiales Family XIII bacterium]